MSTAAYFSLSAALISGFLTLCAADLTNRSEQDIRKEIKEPLIAQGSKGRAKVESAVFGEALAIAENGKARAGILIPKNAKPIVRLAAKELAGYLKKITGADFPIGTTAQFKINFKLGFGDPAGLDNEEFIIRTKDGQIEIFGHDTDHKVSWRHYFSCDEKGTLLGVWYFLELLGVRWPAPGMDHVPEQKTLVLKPLDIRFKPFFRDRHIGRVIFEFMRQPDAREYCKNTDEAIKWYLRIGESVQLSLGCHSERTLELNKLPEWTSDPTRLQLEKNGRRNPRYSCWTHPDVKRLWMKAADDYFSGKTARQAGFKYAGNYAWNGWPYPFFSPDEFMIDPNDNDGVNDGRCYCERCREFREKHPCPDDTELIWDVIADVAESVVKKHPGKYITTLAYPPKRQLPSRKLPSNIRVRLCLSGPKIGLDPVNFDKEIRTIRSWHDVLGNKVPLWTYHCVCFNDSMPGIIETYPHLIQKYVRAMKDSSEGMLMQFMGLTFTGKLLDTYMFHRLMRNPDLDIERELDEYFLLLYGPAHKEARQFYAELENLFADFWNKTVPKGGKFGMSTPWKYHDRAMQKKLWTLTYTEQKMARLGSLIAAMEKKVPPSGPFAKSVRLLRKYIYNALVEERKLTLGKEDIRRKLKLSAATVAPGAAPSEKQWQTAPVARLIPAVRFMEKLDAGGCFRLLTDGKTLFIRAELDEKMMKQTVVRPGQKNGSRDIWRDNCVEFFFASMKDGFRWHLIVNDLGHWSSRRIVRGVDSWFPLPGCRVSVLRQPRGWTVLAAIPLKTLNPSGGELRMNLIRERRVKGRPVEYSTTSPLARLGTWQIPGNFATVRFNK